MSTTFRTVELSDPELELGGLRQMTVKSAALRRRADLTLWVPAEAPRGLPLVVLLHGVYGSHWAWAMKGAAHLTAARLIAEGAMPPMVLAMPSDGLWGDGSGYVRHGNGEDSGRWVAEEVPAAARLACAGLTDASPLFLCGLSMGGYGAMRLAAEHATVVRAAAGHSSVTDFRDLEAFVEEPLAACGVDRMACALGDVLVRHRAVLPALRFDCGTADPLLPQNRALHQLLTLEGVPHEYAEHPGGHSWPYWREHLADSLKFFATHA